ncbi:MAG: PilZ domain-containing protein [Desulfofustis sp.]|nr:PilZ domain-containing protein [Desulfofustis sp.]
MERRQFTRIAVNIPATLSFYQVEACHSGLVADISEGGCFFQFDEDIPVGTQCRVTITVGAGLEREQLTVSGEVVRCATKGLGIRFLENLLEKNGRLAALLSVYRVSR